MGDHKSSHAQELQAMFCVFHSLQNQSLEPPLYILIACYV